MAGLIYTEIYKSTIYGLVVHLLTTCSKEEKHTYKEVKVIIIEVQNHYLVCQKKKWCDLAACNKLS